MAQQASNLPNTYSQIPTGDLIKIYADAPERLNRVLKGLSVKELQAHPKLAKWSIQEIAVHMAEAEIMGAARIRQTFAEPGATFAVYDQDAWARELDYQKFDAKAFYSSLMMFDSLRLNTTKIFRRAKEKDWEKYGMHSELGKLTLRQLLEIYADHGERHIGQILELRALLNVPLKFSLLLKERLY